MSLDKDEIDFSIDNQTEMITKLNLNALVKTSFALLVCLLTFSSSTFAQTLVSASDAAERISEEIPVLEQAIAALDVNDPEHGVMTMKKESLESVSTFVAMNGNNPGFSTRFILIYALSTIDQENNASILKPARGDASFDFSQVSYDDPMSNELSDYLLELLAQ